MRGSFAARVDAGFAEGHRRGLAEGLPQALEEAAKAVETMPIGGFPSRELRNLCARAIRALLEKP
jgi:hypothetical protein